MKEKITLEDKWSWIVTADYSEVCLWADSYEVFEYYLVSENEVYFYYIQNEFVAYIMKFKFEYNKTLVSVASYDYDSGNLEYIEKSGILGFLFGTYVTFETILNKLK